MRRAFPIYFLLLSLFACGAAAQEPPATGAQPLQRITGTITATDQNRKSITVKEDKAGTEYTIELANTRSLRKVDPAKPDLNTATRITSEDLSVGDRVQVFAPKGEGDNSALAARSIILMSARDLQTVHQQEAAAWQHGTSGVVTEVDPSAGKVTISARRPEGRKPMTVDAQKAQFTRYSPERPKTPIASKLADIQIGDQVRVIGQTSADGAVLSAEKIYSSPLRTMLCTVSAVTDEKHLTVKDLDNKQTVSLSLNEESSVRKLPPMVAYGLARRLNPDFKAPQGAGDQQAAGRTNPAVGAGDGAKRGEAQLTANEPARGAGGNGGGPAGGGSGGGFRAGGGVRGGDVSQLLERLPKISATALKPGDAVVVSGMPMDGDKSHLLATNVIAGVEPIFQSASAKQMQSLGDWSLGSEGGGADGMSPQ